MKFRSALIVAILLIVPPLTDGCSSRKSSTVTKTEVSGDVTDGTRARYADSGGTQTTTTETKTEEVHDDASHGGLFSIVGDIIALPFRAVGALLSAIF